MTVSAVPNSVALRVVVERSSNKQLSAYDPTDCQEHKRLSLYTYMYARIHKVIGKRFYLFITLFKLVNQSFKTVLVVIVGNVLLLI